MALLQLQTVRRRPSELGSLQALADFGANDRIADKPDFREGDQRHHINGPRQEDQGNYQTNER